MRLPFPYPATLSTFPSHELRGRPLGLLHSGLSLTERTLWAGSTTGRRATWPYSRSWRSRTMLVTGLEPVSWSSRWFDTKSFQRYPMILRRHLVPKTSRRLSKSRFSVHVSQPIVLSYRILCILPGTLYQSSHTFAILVVAFTARASVMWHVHVDASKTTSSSLRELWRHRPFWWLPWSC